MELKGRGLTEILNDHFNWNKARMNCFVEMLVALIQMRTVNLVKLACAFNSEAKIDSRYKRIQCFFSTFTIVMGVVAAWLMALFGLDKVYLSMDRTNWQWGKSDITVVMLSVVYKGIAFPVLWSLLDKAGNSNTAEWIVLIQKFVNRFRKGRIAGVLGDREFIGNEWFGWLKKESIPFCIRIKKNMLTTNRAGMNRKEKAETMKTQALQIGEENPIKTAATDRTPYGKFCSYVYLSYLEGWQVIQPKSDKSKALYKTYFCMMTKANKLLTIFC